MYHYGMTCLAGNSLVVYRRRKRTAARITAVTDPLGTVHALVASDGTIAVSYTYDSWGNVLSVSGDQAMVTANRFTWQGREYSYATGLYNFRARWYDPAAGRWLSKDPIGLEGGLNLYEAFGNNPVCFVDPEGNNAAAVAISQPTINIIELNIFSEAFAIGSTPVSSLGATSVIGCATVAYMVGYRIGEVLNDRFEISDKLEPYIYNFLMSFRPGSKGERGHTGSASGTRNEWKHRKPHPTDPTKMIEKDSNGKKKIKPKPPNAPWSNTPVIPITNDEVKYANEIESCFGYEFLLFW